MKNANNNEMDLLLRSLARSGRDNPSSSFGAESNSGSEHLDADELNVFAEGLASEAVRARFMEHLADCSRCRGMVVSLNQASGPATRAPVAVSKNQPGFWHAVAALFSIPVLKYAVPVVALAALIGISFLALRRDDRTQFVAGNYGTPATSAPEAPLPQQPSATPPTTTGSAPSAVESRTSTLNAKEPTTSRPNLNEAAKPSNSVDFADKKALRDLPAAPPATAQDVGQSQPSFAPEPKAGTLASETALTSGLKKTEAPSEEQATSRVAQNREREAFKSVGVDKEGEDKSASLYRVSPSGPRRSELPISERRGGASAKTKKDTVDEEDVRSVAGRRFRRQGNVWIDTDYELPRATINIARGSEQYRALVADEPEVGAVASQLDGDVIVLWKGKAYRIH